MTSRPPQISASILNADFAALGAEVRRAADGRVDSIHLDVMDGHFVDNLTMGPVVVEAVRTATDLPFHSHLMIDNPLAYAARFADAGSDLIVFHVEAPDDPMAVIAAVERGGKRAGIALNPETPADAVLPFLDRVDLLHFHDPERIAFEQAIAAGGAVEELVRIRDEGLAGHLGVAGGPASLMGRYLATGVFEVLLTHNRWTLADRSADAVITQAHDAGYGVINGAPFGGGHFGLPLRRQKALLSTFEHGRDFLQFLLQALRRRDKLGQRVLYVLAVDGVATG